jgi:hypothetical protein
MRPDGADYRVRSKVSVRFPTLTGAFAFELSDVVGGRRGFTLLGAWKLPKPARGLDLGMVLDKDEGLHGH